MSTYTHRSTATCRVAFPTLEHTIRACAHFACADRDSLPTDLSTHSAEELYEEFQPYFQSLDGNQVTIAVDTEEGYYCTEFFDYIVELLCKVQSGDFVQVNWSGWDSREGVSGGCDYYGKNGAFIDLDEAIASRSRIEEIKQILRSGDDDCDQLVAIEQIINRAFR
jgi:hypothetical protein